MTRTKKTDPSLVQGGLRKYDAPLPILVGVRVRLSNEQRLILKDAYAKKREEYTPQAQQKIGASSVTTSTQYTVASQLGLSDVVLADILGSRESISLTTIISIQNILEVQAVTPDDVRKACESYVNYVFGVNDAA